MSLDLKKHKRATIALGTIVEITIWISPEQNVSAIFKAAYHAISTIHAKMSVHDDASDLGRYRLAANNVSVPISAATIEVLQFSETLFLQSQGYFDVCIGGALVNANYLPSEICLHLQYQTRKQPLEITQIKTGENGTVKKIPNTIIDLGGVSKGYAVDCAIQVLQTHNVPAALVNAGGDMRIYGEIPAPIHIRKKSGFTYLKDLKNRALASSGMPTNHEIEKKVLPIINPFSGSCLPQSHQILSVEADKAMEADALTKLAWLNVLDESLLNSYNAKLIS